jgi:hypothetical protein
MAMAKVVATYKGSGLAFAAHLKVLQIQCCHINDHLHTCLEQIYKLPGYSGPHPPVAAPSVPPAPPTVPSTTLEIRVEDHIDGNHIHNKDELHDDEDKDEMLCMVDTLAKIMV